MLLSTIKIKNFRALKETPAIALSQMPTIIGRNDTGKSSILHALAVFFGQRKLNNLDFHAGSGGSDLIEIEASFTDIDDDAKSFLQQRKLLDSLGCLVVKKTYDRELKPKPVEVKAYDFIEPDFQNLWSRKEKELNDLGRKYGLDFTQSGRSITNESKIEELIRYAESKQIAKADVWILPDKDISNKIENYLPDFYLFPSELSLETEQSSFQNPFQDLIVRAIDIDNNIKDAVQKKVGEAVEEAMRKIQKNLTEQTDSITQLIPKPNIQWKKLVSLDIDTIDQFGTQVPLSSRGLGVRRLLMVAFFKFDAERAKESGKNGRIYAIEEPETFLHPRGQRDLIEAFRRLKEAGSQVIVTSHSPVFAAEAGNDDLVLVTREEGIARIMQGKELQLELIANELGILPRDTVAGYAACIFVEGPADQFFLEAVSRTLYEAGKTACNLKDKKIGVVPVGGNNLKFFVEKELILKRLNRRFAVVIDSDRTQATDQIPTKVLNWKKKCEEEGGKFFILRKRAIENYLHPDAIKRVHGRPVTVEDYNKVKELISTDYDWNKHLKPVVEAMTADEILEKDRYNEGTNVKHEFLELFDAVFKLVGD
jgi:putative ATP-dependent endonuclease of OLD family